MRLFLAFATLSLIAAGCGDDTTPGPSQDMAVSADMLMCGGGPVSGAMDNHCYDDGGANFVAVDPTQCGVDAGDTSGGGGDFGETMYNTHGNDDDCKYDVSYTVGGVCRNSDTFFTVTLKNATDNSPVKMGLANGGMFRAEVFLTDTHPANTSKATTVDMGNGVYKFGPIQFDAAGKWTVRFHFFENCTDTPTSPHGHAAFYVNVP